MKNYPLLKTLFGKTEKEFTDGLTELLISREFLRFTLWEVTGGNICKPKGGNRGITEGTFDIFDLGYNGSNFFRKEIALNFFGKTYLICAGFFCRIHDNAFVYAITFHHPISGDAYDWLQALSPFIAMRVEELKSEQSRMEIFVDYQKKIDFVKDSGIILKALTLYDVMVNALNFFANTFHSEVSCVMLDDIFVGFGVNKEDLQNNIFVDDLPITDYIVMRNDTEFLEQDLQSSKFNIDNAFMVREPTFGAIFLLFNITVDILPDKEFSALISHIVAIAIENAKYHERATKLKLEEVEMYQTVEILNQFVEREIENIGIPYIYGVSRPARSTGGDYTTVIDNEDYVFICIADVCGKGYSAAVFTVMLSTIMGSDLCKNITDIANLANNINQYMLCHRFDERFITAFLCCYDKKAGVLKYISCGHEPTMLITESGTKRLVSLNLPLGILNENYEVHEEVINAGEFMFIYTDGIIEYINHDNLQLLLEDWRNKSPKDVVLELYDRLVPSLDEQRDDFTCVAVKF